MLRSVQRVGAICLVGLAGLVPREASVAATSTTTFNVQMTITNSCLITSATNMNFGTVGVVTILGLSATSTVTVQCSLLAPFNIGLDPGLGVGATVTTRVMTGPGGNTMGYSLFQDLTHLVNWGQTIGTNTVASLGTGLAVPFTVFGFVPSQTTAPAGTYSDTITVTVTF
jgi:spore coat protein U-like protein